MGSGQRVVREVRARRLSVGCEVLSVSEEVEHREEESEVLASSLSLARYKGQWLHLLYFNIAWENPVANLPLYARLQGKDSRRKAFGNKRNPHSRSYTFVLLRDKRIPAD